VALYCSLSSIFVVTLSGAAWLWWEMKLLRCEAMKAELAQRFGTCRSLLFRV